MPELVLPESALPELALPESELPETELRAAPREVGQAIVEFSLVAGILFMMLVAVFDLGRGVAAQASLAHAVNEAAKQASFGADSEPQKQAIRSVVCQQATLAPGLSCASGGGVSVAVATVSGVPKTATVSVSYDLTPVTPLIGQMLPGGKVTLQAMARTVVP